MDDEMDNFITDSHESIEEFTEEEAIQFDDDDYMDSSHLPKGE